MRMKMPIKIIVSDCVSLFQRRTGEKCGIFSLLVNIGNET